MKKVFLFILIIILAACSSVKQTTSLKDSNNLSVECSKYKSFKMKGDFAGGTENDAQSAQLSINIASVDSIQLTINALFGVPVGSFYANKDYFSIFNMINNTIYEGTPSEKNIKQTINIPISFNDLISILKSTTPFSFSDYQEETSSSQKLFRYNKNSEFVDFALFSENFQLTQYQRKTRDGKIVLDVVFQNYINVDNCNLAQTIIMDFPQSKMKATLGFDKIEAVSGFEKQFSIKNPGSVNRINMDEID